MNKLGNWSVRSVLYAGLVAGTVDIGVASLIYRRSPEDILQSVASGVLGKASFGAGLDSALLGLGLQWAMSLVIAGVYAAIAGATPRLVGRWIFGGVVYGLVVFVVMNYIVVPLSAAAPPHWFTLQHLLHRFTPAKFGENLLAMILFGLIVAFFTGRAARASPPENVCREIGQ